MTKNQESYADANSPRHGQALSTVIAKYVAGILVGGMAVYASVQYFLMPNESVMRLVVEHISHVMFLMLLLYITLYIVLLKVVVSPIHRFRAKLYRVAGGDLKPVREVSRISEIQEIADGINLMIERLATELPHASPSELSGHATELRSLAIQSDNLRHGQKDILLNAAQEMESLVSLITKNLVRMNEANGNVEK